MAGRVRAALKCERCGKRGVKRECGNVTCADCPCWCWGGEGPTCIRVVKGAPDGDA